MKDSNDQTRFAADRARSADELARCRETTLVLLEEARSALDARQPGPALASLEGALEVPPTLDLVEDIASLASAVRTLESQLETSRVAKSEGKTRRRRVHEVKKRAEARQAPKYAAAHCSAAAAVSAGAAADTKAKTEAAAEEDAAAEAKASAEAGAAAKAAAQSEKAARTKEAARKKTEA